MRSTVPHFFSRVTEVNVAGLFEFLKRLQTHELSSYILLLLLEGALSLLSISQLLNFGNPGKILRAPWTSRPIRIVNLLKEGIRAVLWISDTTETLNVGASSPREQDGDRKVRGPWRRNRHHNVSGLV